MTTLAAKDLLEMSQSQLDDLFRNAPPGPIPKGDAKGTAIIAAGTSLQGPGAHFANWVAWRGKVFDPSSGTLVNKITPLNIHAIKAQVYRQESWFDGQEAIILDYSRTSLLARNIRDEIREVAPGLYLGQVYWRKLRVCNFALTFATAAR